MYIWLVILLYLNWSCNLDTLRFVEHERSLERTWRVATTTTIVVKSCNIVHLERNQGTACRIELTNRKFAKKSLVWLIDRTTAQLAMKSSLFDYLFRSIILPSPFLSCALVPFSFSLLDEDDERKMDTLCELRQISFRF